MKHIVLTLIVLLSATAICAQPLRGLQSEGPMPADLKMTLSELYQSDLQRATNYAGGTVRRENRQDLLEVSYNVNKMMANGRIVYGDPISQYISRIADVLLRDYPELRSELRFYTVKSPEVNAYATGQGMVFVNAGLVAQVENEAQLAFVLSHEIVHYYRNHILEEIVGKDKKNKRDIEKEASELEIFLSHHSRSRAMESEADSLGLALFYLQSPWSRNVTEGVFDVLQYASLPFDDLPFDTTFFNTPYYKYTGCWLDSVAPITTRDNYDDSRSTHPNILSRRRATAAIIDGYYGGDDYVVASQAEFVQLRHLARVECLRQELLNGQYSRAFYNAWVLLQNERNTLSPAQTEELSQALAQAIYGIAIFKNRNNTNSVTGDYTKIEGESQQIYYAMRQLSAEQATYAALHLLWQLHSRYPDNDALRHMVDDLFAELRISLRKSTIDFMYTPPKQEADTASKPADEGRALSKYERIKQKRQQQTMRAAEAYVFTDLTMTDSTFAAVLRRSLTTPSVASAEADTVPNGNVLMYNPSYWVVNDKTDELKIIKSDNNERFLSQHLVGMTERFGRKTIDFSDASLHDIDSASRYNEFVSIVEWMREFMQSKDQFNPYRFTQPAMDDIVYHYDAPIISVASVLNLENLEPDISSSSMFLIPMIPVYVYNVIANREATGISSFIIDVSRGRILAREEILSRLDDSRATIDAALYDAYSHAFRNKEAHSFLNRHLSITGGMQLGLSGQQSFSIRPFALTPWATIEIPFGKRYSFTASWSQQSACDSVNLRTHDAYDMVPVGSSPLPNTDYSRKATTLSADIRIYGYNKDVYAPVGPYLSVGLHSVLYTRPSNGKTDDYALGLNIAAGRNWVFFNRLVLNIEARYAYTAFLIDSMKDAEIQDNMRYRLDGMLSNLFKLKIGIGIIPF